MKAEIGRGERARRDAHIVMRPATAMSLALSDGEAVCRRGLAGRATSETLHAVALKGPAAGTRKLVAVLHEALLHGPIVAEIFSAKMRSIPAARALLLRRARVLSQSE
jgi:hypothetical protein